MNRYLVVWTYMANYGAQEIDAPTAEQAAKILVGFFSADFGQHGTLYVAKIADIQKFEAKDLL